MLKASILITNYNNEKYIKECIESCLRQEYKEFEIIVFDDASTDGSLKIISSFRDKRIKIIKNSKRKTKYSTLNQIYGLSKAFQKSNGKIIFLLDGDDFFKKNKLKVIIENYQNKKWSNFIQDIPIYYFTKKHYEHAKELKVKKTKSTIWPHFFSTSTICVERNYLRKCFKDLSYSSNKFNRVFFDARICIYTYFKNNEIKVIKKNLTYYRQNIVGDTSLNKYNTVLSKNWWRRRLDYHNFIKKFCMKYKLDYKSGLDSSLTKIINFFI